MMSHINESFFIRYDFFIKEINKDSPLAERSSDHKVQSVSVQVTVSASINRKLVDFQTCDVHLTSI